MSQQEFNYILFTSNQELANLMDLLLNEEWLKKSIQASDTQKAEKITCSSALGICTDRSLKSDNLSN